MPRITTPPTSNQDAFNRAWDRLITRAEQGRCANKAGTCLYIDSTGNNCVVGDMLPDEINKELKTGTINLLYLENKKVQQHFSAVDSRFLGSLQFIHDTIDQAKQKAELETLAETYGLTLPNYSIPTP